MVEMFAMCAPKEMKITKDTYEKIKNHINKDKIRIIYV